MMHDDCPAAGVHPQLSPQVWKRVAELWRHLASVPVSKPDRAVEALWDGFATLFDFDRCWLVLVHRDKHRARARELGSLDGWVLAEIFRRPALDPRHVEIQKKFRRHLLEKDRWARAMAETAGRNRTLRRQDVLGDEPWSSCPTGEMMEVMGLHDRMVAGHALDDVVEVHLGFDRESAPAFSATEAAITDMVNDGLRPFFARLAMSFGLFRHQQALQPRQRETLLLLIDGCSDKEVAEKMGISIGSAHQYVVSVFRSLGVRGRSELMSTWMDHFLIGSRDGHSG